MVDYNDELNMLPLAKFFYDKCGLITPYSSNFFSRQQLPELADRKRYSLQAASTMYRLDSMSGGNGLSKTVWFDRESRINCIDHYLDISWLRLTRAEVKAMSDAELEQFILHEITNIEYDRMGMSNETYPTILLVLGFIVEGNFTSNNADGVINGIIDDPIDRDIDDRGVSDKLVVSSRNSYNINKDSDYYGSWQLLSRSDQDKLLSVYGLINEEEDADLWTYQTPVKFMMLTNLQSAVAREVAAFYDDSFESRGYDLLQGLIGEIY